MSPLDLVNQGCAGISADALHFAEDAAGVCDAATDLVPHLLDVADRLDVDGRHQEAAELRAAVCRAFTMWFFDRPEPRQGVQA